MSYNPKDTANRIRGLRREKGLSQYQLAIDINVSRDLISKVECAVYQPSAELLVLLSEYFSVSTDFILKGSTSSSTLSSEIQDIIYRLTRIVRNL